MGHRAVRRAYPEIERSLFIPHQPFLGGRWTGVLQMEWTVDQAHPLVIGAGWFGLRGGTAQTAPRPIVGPRRVGPLRQTPPEVVSEIVRRGEKGLPVIPGSSLKGAIRQVFELLTPSCQLVPGRTCRAKPSDSEPQVCPACSLFGAPGLGGRAAFGEAEPVPNSTTLSRTKTPTAWQPRRWEDGTVRVYDQRKATTPDHKAAPEEEPTWTVWGKFHSRIRLVNASDEELGLLFASLGIGAGRPMLRLGGKKFHGFGATDVAVERALQDYPRRATLDGPEAAAWAQALADRWVRQVPARNAAWESLHEALSAG